MKKTKILIVEDNETDRRVCRRFLLSCPNSYFEISDADTAAKGFELLKSEEFDCLILDYQLPDENGLKLLERIGDLATPTIIITGQPEPNLVTEAYKRGASRYISKDSMTSRELCEAVREVVSK